MPRVSPAYDNMPPAAAGALQQLGADLATARKRRRESLRDWAARLNVSHPTLIKMERGDPAVAIGIFATALWMIQRLGPLASAADPKEDLGALETEVKAASARGLRRVNA